MIAQSLSKRTFTARFIAAGAVFALSGVFGALDVRSETPDPPVPLFDESRLVDAPLALEVSAPWRQLRRKSDDEDSFSASMRLPGLEAPLDLTVEKRGVSRQELCSMPPIRFRFEEDQVEGTVFEGNRSIKVVTHCKRGSNWEQYVMLEMLAYRLYGALTDLSFRVRPATILYVDSERDRSDGPRIAFLIEDDRLVGNRHGLDKVDVDEIRVSDLPDFETSVFMLFQYMIGNVDFSPLSSRSGECCHNAKLIGNEETLEQLYAVPYDFDSSGWVNTSYATPPEGLRLRNIRQRLFRGFCRHNGGLPKARELFMSRQEDFYRILGSESELSSRNEKRSRRYLDDFFETLADDRDFERRIIEQCRS